MTEETIEAISRRMESHEAHEALMAQKLDSISDQLRELRPLLTEAVRLSGQHDRLTDALVRIGKQVDAHDSRLNGHDKRIGGLERSEAGLGERTTGNRQLINIIIISIASPIMTAAVVYWITRGGP